jgi:hypothetical protein
VADSENLIRRQIAEQMQETFASALNAVTWALLRQPARTPDENEKMQYAAFASAYHHLETGTAADRQRAAWLISRVYAVQGNGAEALRHAQRCMELSEQNADAIADYDAAFALEALARAHAVAGNKEEAAKFRAQAEQAGKAIRDDESRKVFIEELNAGR